MPEVQVVHIPEEAFDAPTSAEVERADRARANAEKFDAFTRGARARADQLPRDYLAQLGFATADLMLMHLVTGRYKPKSAKEAAEVARIAAEIGRKEAGEADASSMIATPEQRETAIRTVVELVEIAKQRAKQQQATIDADVVDVDEVLQPALEPAPPSIPPTTPTARVLSRVRRVDTTVALSPED